MLSAEQIRAKIYKLADDFEMYYRKKEYALAKAAYDNASTMAVFMELPQEDMYELFMNHSEDDSRDAKPEWGKFDMDKVQECYWWCIQRNKTRENEPFHQPEAMR